MNNVRALRSDFNPRSLTGATQNLYLLEILQLISIHAPSRERQSLSWKRQIKELISIHAPSRERQEVRLAAGLGDLFQSTLPHGSDHKVPF